MRRRKTRPMGVEPVKATLSMSAWSARSEPMAPEPSSTLNTPGGKPASAQISANSSADKRVYVAGFSTTVLPIANAGHTCVNRFIRTRQPLLAERSQQQQQHNNDLTFQANNMIGKFHGTISPITPSGFQPAISSAICERDKSRKNTA
jgi:hypothetical protein